MILFYPLFSRNVYHTIYPLFISFESFVTKKSLKKILRLFCGVYEARTRDPMRDRHVF